MAEHVAPTDEPRPPQHADGAVITPSEPSHRAGSQQAQDQGTRARHRRRVKTEPPPGSDPNPEPETQRPGNSDNDDQLKRDVPPHWG